jgi:hypothetical protein
MQPWLNMVTLSGLTIATCVSKVSTERLSVTWGLPEFGRCLKTKNDNTLQNVAKDARQIKKNGKVTFERKPFLSLQKRTAHGVAK